MLITEIESAVKVNCGRDYTEFNNEIRGWINRFIKEQCCTLYNFWFMKHSETIPTVASTRSYNLPTRYKDDVPDGIVYRDSSGNTTPLDVLNDADIKKEYSLTDTGTPEAIVIGETTYDVYPLANGAYNIDWVCYVYLADLSDSNTSNWFTNNYAQMLIDAGTADGFSYLGEHEEAAVWMGKAIEKLNDLVSYNVQRQTGKIIMAPRADVNANLNSARTWE